MRSIAWCNQPIRTPAPLATATPRSTSWQYDRMGRVIHKDQVIGGILRTTRYAFDAKGQLIGMATPSGNVIHYLWTNGQITAVKAGKDTIAANLSYQPFGPIKSWTF